MNANHWVLLNGQKRELPTDGRRLIDWLRDDLRLTGSKEPCGAGHCGGCSVLLDGEVVLSCCMLASTIAGRQLITIEGFIQEGGNDPLLDTFVLAGATQCGYCTPGMIVAARAFLQEATRSSEYCVDERVIRAGLAGNMCRCTGYVQIVEAVLMAAQQEGLTCVPSTLVKTDAAK